MGCKWGKGGEESANHFDGHFSCKYIKYRPTPLTVKILTVFAYLQVDPCLRFLFWQKVVS